MCLTSSLLLLSGENLSNIITLKAMIASSQASGLASATSKSSTSIPSTGKNHETDKQKQKRTSSSSTSSSRLNLNSSKTHRLKIDDNVDIDEDYYCDNHKVVSIIGKDQINEVNSEQVYENDNEEDQNPYQDQIQDQDDENKNTNTNTNKNNNKENKKQLKLTAAKRMVCLEGQQQVCCCAECNKHIKASFFYKISQSDRRWHADCFRCAICRKKLEHEASCFEVGDGKVICAFDYATWRQTNGVRCAQCNWPIAASDWVRRAGTYVYHLACFTCYLCKRQLNTGEQFTLSVTASNSSSLTSEQVPKNKIQDYSVSMLLDEQETKGQVVYLEQKKAKILCKIHFSTPTNNEHLATNLSSKQQKKQSTAKTMHKHQLTTSPPPVSNLDTPLCRQMSSSSVPLSLSLPLSMSMSMSMPMSMPMPMPMCGSTSNTDKQILIGANNSSEQTRKTPTIEFDDVASNNSQLAAVAVAMMQLDNTNNTWQSSNPNSNPNPNPNPNQNPDLIPNLNTNQTIQEQQAALGTLPTKTKRVRTTFTEDQLRVLQTNFETDSNPDGQDLERIASMTGLSKRVTQVWFQNSRARQKKHLTKRPRTGAATLAAGNSLSSNYSMSSCTVGNLGLRSMRQYEQRDEQCEFGLANEPAMGGFCGSSLASRHHLDANEFDASPSWLTTAANNCTSDNIVSSQKQYPCDDVDDDADDDVDDEVDDDSDDNDDDDDDDDEDDLETVNDDEDDTNNNVNTIASNKLVALSVQKSAKQVKAKTDEKNNESQNLC